MALGSAKQCLVACAPDRAQHPQQSSAADLCDLNRTEHCKHDLTWAAAELFNGCCEVHSNHMSFTVKHDVVAAH